MIKVEGLPEGFEVNTIYINAKENVSQCFNTVQATIHLKKIQPRRIVLEETGRKIDFSYTQNFKFGDELISVTSSSVLHEVKETEEPKLSLGVDECKEAMRKLETFNVTDLSVKICRFLKEHS